MQRILITPGEPAGCGPDLVVMIAANPAEFWGRPVELCVIGDPDMLIARAQQLSLPLTLEPCDIHATPARPSTPNTLKIIPIACKEQVIAGTLNVANASYVLETLKTAVDLMQDQKAAALMTGPVHKGVINDAGFAFTGHTEFFAQSCGVENPVMLFVVGDQLKVALVTTHIALAKVPSAITKSLLHNTIHTVRSALKQQFKIAEPRIIVCGLNPHAGESGHLGREEIDTIIPVINELQQRGEKIVGPLPADTVFTPKHMMQADIILSMYHDQALPVVKYAGFGEAVNMTLGLPFIRTSVDHGTALDIAGSGKADAGSMIAALKLAIWLGR